MYLIDQHNIRSHRKLNGMKKVAEKRPTYLKQLQPSDFSDNTVMMLCNIDILLKETKKLKLVDV